MARSWRPPERPNFAEFPFRNCLEIRDRSRMGVRERPRRVEGVPIRVHLVATEARSRCLRLFSKQFRKGNSTKFAVTEFSEVRRTPEDWPLGRCAESPHSAHS